MSKIRKSARGQPCLVRIPGVCKGNTETTVLAHKNGSGWGRKGLDMIAAFCCYECHQFIDGGWVRSEVTKEEMLVWFYEGIFRTQEYLHQQKLIQTPGSK